MDTPEVRDLFACLGAIVSESDGASLFRVAALPQFEIDPEELRAGMKAMPRELRRKLGWRRCWDGLRAGRLCWRLVRQAREQIAGRTPRAGRRRDHRAVLWSGYGVAAFAGGTGVHCEWEKKAITKTKEMAELLEYLEYFREAGGGIP